MFPWRVTGALACFGVCAFLQGDLGDRIADLGRSDFRYTPDPKVVFLAAGPFRSTAADLLWLRTLPDMSKEFTDPAVKARWIHNSLDAITDLEPTFGTVYVFAEGYLTQLGRVNPASLDRAVALLSKGHRENPKSAGLLVRLAMIEWDRHDRAKAMEYLRKAQPLDDMDVLSNQMLATLEADQRDDLMALGRWLPSVLNENYPQDMRDDAWNKLYAIKEKIAQRAIVDFKQKHGRLPTQAKDLDDPDLIQPGKATEVVLAGLEIKDGRAFYADAQQYVIKSYARLVRREAQRWHAERGRWPSLDELFAAELKLPSAPAGKLWVLEEDRLSLVSLDGGK
jgi:hypothetical protein